MPSLLTKYMDVERYILLEKMVCVVTVRRNLIEEK